MLQSCCPVSCTIVATPRVCIRQSGISQYSRSSSGCTRTASGSAVQPRCFAVYRFSILFRFPGPHWRPPHVDELWKRSRAAPITPPLPYVISCSLLILHGSISYYRRPPHVDELRAGGGEGRRQQHRARAHGSGRHGTAPITPTTPPATAPRRVSGGGMFAASATIALIAAAVQHLAAAAAD